LHLGVQEYALTYGPPQELAFLLAFVGQITADSADKMVETGSKVDNATAAMTFRAFKPPALAAIVAGSRFEEY